MNPAMVSGDDDGSSIPAGASFYRFVPVINRLTKDFLTGASLSVVHSMKAFRAFNADGAPRAFIVNLGMHTTVNVDPRLAQYLLSGRDEVSVFAERLQLGYLFDGSKVFQAPGMNTFAPPTTKVAVSDTASTDSGVKIDEGATFSFGVTEKVTVSITDWVVSLEPSSNQVLWDYWIKSPYDVMTELATGRVRTYPNLSLVGFSFDCTAWFEIDDVKLTSLTFQPVLRLRLHSRDPGGPEPHRIDFMGDGVINKGPFWQPALTIDLTRVPDRGPRTSPPGP